MLVPERKGTSVSSNEFDVCLRADVPLKSYMSFLPEVLNILVFFSSYEKFYNWCYVNL